jgi:hypothetical protein
MTGFNNIFMNEDIHMIRRWSEINIGDSISNFVKHMFLINEITYDNISNLDKKKKKIKFINNLEWFIIKKEACHIFKQLGYPIIEYKDLYIYGKKPSQMTPYEELYYDENMRDIITNYINSDL